MPSVSREYRVEDKMINGYIGVAGMRIGRGTEVL
jgi:hypothetical protein